MDAGHGGADGGAVSDSGVAESGLNLAITLRLADVLTFCGYEVLLTRTGEEALCDDPAATLRQQKVSDTKKRVEIINSCADAWLISIHQNSYPEAEISGPQVFYYGSSEMSKKLAEAIQAQLIVDLQPPKEREIKTGNDLYILKNSQCPGVIVECGFLSNPTECENLQNPQYQQAVAAAIARAICKL